MVGVGAAGGRADQLVIDGVNHPRVRIKAFERGLVHYRLTDGTKQAAWIDRIDRIVVDTVPGLGDFNEAERYLAQDEPGKSIVRYERAQRVAKRFWPDLIGARLLVACDRAGRLDRATLNFIKAAGGSYSGVAAASRLIPTNIPDQRNPAVVRAIQQLDTAIARVSDDGQTALFTLLRYEVFRRTGNPRAAEEESAIARLAIPETARSAQAYRIQFAALTALLQGAHTAAKLAWLDRAIADCPASVLPSFLLLKGSTLMRTATTRDDIIRASWVFMRVAIHVPDDPRAAEGLYLTALAMEQLGRPDKAKRLLAECLEHKRITDDTRRLAQAAFERMAPASNR